jgi:deoxyribonuclease V
MKVCVDVDYRTNGACAAALTFRDWSDAKAMDEKAVCVSNVEPYVPGEFFRRELPCLLAVLETLPPVETIVIDGYVWLDNASKLGLGGHLYKALGGRVEVVGIAKTKFRGAVGVCETVRGTSTRPLYVSAAGVEVHLAAGWVRSMHGKYRIPSLLARVDYLCRHEQIA